MNVILLKLYSLTNSPQGMPKVLSHNDFIEYVDTALRYNLYFVKGKKT